MPEMQQTLDRFLAKHKIRLRRIEHHPNNPHMQGFMPVGSAHWKVNIGYYGSMTLYYSQGPAIQHPPTLKDIIESLVFDAHLLEGGECEEMAVINQNDKFKRVLGSPDIYNELLYETECW